MYICMWHVRLPSNTIKRLRRVSSPHRPPRWTEACTVSVVGLSWHCSHKDKQTEPTKGLMFQNACQLLRARTLPVVGRRTRSRSDALKPEPPPTQRAGSPVECDCCCCCVCVCFSCFCHDTEEFKCTCPSIFLHVSTGSPESISVWS